MQTYSSRIVLFTTEREDVEFQVPGKESFTAERAASVINFIVVDLSSCSEYKKGREIHPNITCGPAFIPLTSLSSVNFCACVCIYTPKVSLLWRSGGACVVKGYRELCWQ
jgi:hypothetical protein